MAGLQTLGLKLGRGDLNGEEAAERVQGMMTIASQTVELLERLLDLSAIESGTAEPHLEHVDLGEILARCVSVHRQAAEDKKIELTVETAPELPKVMADPIRLAEVVDNLLSNAIKYTFPGGWVRLSCSVRDGEVVISVQDSGQGLSTDDLEQVFRSFKRLSAQPTAGESSKGLGLAIAKTIVEMHQGRIWVESDKGRGSTFSFSLPVV